jgi:predicted transcriptional regulator
MFSLFTLYYLNAKVVSFVKQHMGVYTIMITARQLKFSRNILRLSTRELCVLSGVSPSTISRAENGADVKYSTIKKLAKVFESKGIAYPTSKSLKHRGVLVNFDDSHKSLCEPKNQSGDYFTSR